jgi:hypothetical protein
VSVDSSWRQTVNEKASSGRFLWCSVSAFVFGVLALRGDIEPSAVLNVVLLVIGFYFGQRGAEGKP